MNVTPKISVVIPTFNRSDLIGRAIESVLVQTVVPAELIVVDDGSTDATQNVCSRYANSIIYHRQLNQGASSSRNTGIGLSSSPWIAFLDSDDYWLQHHLERLANAIQITDGQGDMYFSDMQLPDSEGGGSLWETSGFRPRRPIQLVHDATAWVLLKRQPMMLQTSVIRREALARVRDLSVRFRLVHDTYLFCQLGIRGAACAVGGIGCVQTSEDHSSTRLTVEIPIGSLTHFAEVCELWSEVLKSRGALPAKFRRLVRYRYADSQLRTAKHLVRSGHSVAALTRAVRSVIGDPRLALWIVRHGNAADYEATISPPCQEFCSTA